MAYLRAVNSNGNCNVGFVLGKAKLAPQHKPTIPHPELCAAVLAVEIADLIRHEIDLRLDAIRFYCQSNGSMSRLSSTQLAMALEELLHSNSMIWHGSK